MSENDFSEVDLLKLFARKDTKKRSRANRFFRAFFMFLALYIAVFVLINFRSLNQSFRYWYRVEYGNESLAKQQAYGLVQEKIAQGKPVSDIDENSLPNIPDNHLTIESIAVNAPITWKVNNTDSEVAANLQNGLIQLNGTALPGEIGNVFVTGHSSDYPWTKGSYKTVFSLLNRVVVGDIVHIKYQNKNYLYQVSEIKVVNPDDLSVLAPSQSSILTLMTCTPVGTSLRRLIVISKQIYPSSTPAINKPAEKSTPTKLPKTR